MTGSVQAFRASSIDPILSLEKGQYFGDSCLLNQTLIFDYVCFEESTVFFAPSDAVDKFIQSYKLEEKKPLLEFTEGRINSLKRARRKFRKEEQERLGIEGTAKHKRGLNEVEGNLRGLLSPETEGEVDLQPSSHLKTAQKSVNKNSQRSENVGLFGNLIGNSLNRDIDLLRANAIAKTASKTGNTSTSQKSSETKAGIIKKPKKNQVAIVEMPKPQNQPVATQKPLKKELFRDGSMILYSRGYSRVGSSENNNDLDIGAPQATRIVTEPQDKNPQKEVMDFEDGDFFTPRKEDEDQTKGILEGMENSNPLNLLKEVGLSGKELFSEPLKNIGVDFEDFSDHSSDESGLSEEEVKGINFRKRIL